MSLFVPTGYHDLGNIIGSHESIRPTITFGSTVTPGFNSKGSYSEIFTSAEVAFDVYGIWLNINGVARAASAKDTLVDIGVDPSGGSSYSILIPDLLASSADGLTGICYYFPLFIKAGSSIAARGSQNASPNDFTVYGFIQGGQRSQHLLQFGTRVIAYGINSAASCGTTFTSGTTSEGSWTSIGTTSENHWYWQMGMGISDGSITNGNIYSLDFAFGDASNKHIVIQDQLWIAIDANENILSTGAVTDQCIRSVKSGTDLYIRGQCSGTPDSSLSAAVYGVI